jgi:hypothetical protein
MGKKKVTLILKTQNRNKTRRPLVTRNTSVVPALSKYHSYLHDKLFACGACGTGLFEKKETT